MGTLSQMNRQELTAITFVYDGTKLRIILHIPKFLLSFIKIFNIKVENYEFIF